MIGCAFTYTPTVTGKIRINIAGIASNTTNGGGTTVTARYGTGAAPAGGATVPTSTVLGIPQHLILQANNQVGFMIMDIPTTFVVGTTYWFDLSVVATSGTAGVKDIQFTLIEL
jgi:hypothetical protein